MASWDFPAVSSPSTASYAPPVVQFPDLFADYVQGKEAGFKLREQQRQEDATTAFRNGIPKTASGLPDYSAMSERLLQLGQIPTAVSLQNTGIEMQRMQNGQAVANSYLAPQPVSSAAPPTAAPQVSPQSGTPAAPARPAVSAAPAAAKQPTTVMTILAAQGIPNYELQAASEHVARQLGVDPTAPIDTQDPQVRNVLGPAIAELKRMHIGEVVSPAAPPTQPTPANTTQPTAQPPVAYTNQAQAAPALHPQVQVALQSRLDAMPAPERRGFLYNLATSPAFPKEINEWAEKRIEAMERAEEPTNEIKNTQYDSANNGALTRHEAAIAGAKEEATAPYKIAQAAVREGGRPVAVKPNEVITTGSQLDPALSGFTEWASRRIGAPPVATGVPAAASPAPPAPGAPAPAAASAAPQPGRSAFTPQLVRNPDGSMASTVTPSTESLQKGAAADYEKSREVYNSAQEVQSQLAGMEDAARSLDKAGWSTTGSGANARLALAKTVNSIWSTMGVKDQNLPFDPNAVASWEKLTKETTRLGFQLARTMGAREAAQIVQGAINANPNAENTPLGFKSVLASIRQVAERQADYYQFATRYAQQHGGDLVGADVEFNKLNPPSLYARRAIVQARKDIPQEAVEALRNNPGSAAAFDQHYGGRGLAKLFLGNAGGAQ